MAVSILRRLMDEGMDQKNIVKFHEAFLTTYGKGMVFEMLDMDVVDFFSSNNDQLPLSDISCITKQVATALDVLKTYSIIHADVKLENVMVCDHSQRPIQVKLIDFGMALYASEARPGLLIQNVCYRAPEVMLGCPFNEAVDVWGVGTMTAMLLLGYRLLHSSSDYDATDEEVQDKYGHRPKLHHTEQYRSLHEIMETRYNLSDLEEDKELHAATVLLHKMLEPDVHSRITPAEILQDPFICGQSTESEMEEEAEPVDKKDDQLSESMENVASLSSNRTEDRDSDQERTKARSALPQDEQQSDSIESVMRRTTSPEMIMVRPTTRVNTCTLEEDEQQDEQQSDSVESVVRRTTSPEIIMARAALPENTYTLEEDEQQSDSIESVMRRTTSPEMIMVRPTTRVNTCTLEEDEQQDEQQSDSVKSEKRPSPDIDWTGGQTETPKRSERILN
ncbi:homeodomain-interacting protein kinase 2-like [Periophthalmus magnuspinnatus]|uniref:homeodomain-interacting protein kinase 2-like n=1 Tax=Periophthalmus magnuspinnatus TaxID=409849 RepID=UPI00145A73E6|nr:homeodomain-interacting protein kinase 2-like [Periophthalmus magnuspinnatus]